MFSRCANPDCSVEFDYHYGRFFRFHREDRAKQFSANMHGVEHHWLCGDCCKAHTLEREGENIVVASLPVISPPDNEREFAAQIV